MFKDYNKMLNRLLIFIVFFGMASVVACGPQEHAISIKYPNTPVPKAIMKSHSKTIKVVDIVDKRAEHIIAGDSATHAWVASENVPRLISDELKIELQNHGFIVVDDGQDATLEGALYLLKVECRARGFECHSYGTARGEFSVIDVHTEKTTRTDLIAGKSHVTTSMDEAAGAAIRDMILNLISSEPFQEAMEMTGT